MNGSHHIDLTLSVAKAMGFANPGLISEFADFPDRVDDIEIKGVGTSIFGKKICSLTHFPIRTTTVKTTRVYPPADISLFRGYGWKLDTSVPHLDLPNARVNCIKNNWVGVVDPHLLDEHPLVLLLKTRGYTKYADEITYPAAGSMAYWLSLSKKSSSIMGSSVHFIQDACVFQHCKGWLLEHHASYESCIQDLWFSQKDSRQIKSMLKKYGTSGKNTCSPRRAVEQASEWTSFNMNPSVPVKQSEFLSLTETAISFTSDVLRWWRDVR